MSCHFLKISNSLIFSHFLHFLCFSPSKRCRYNCTTNFLHHSFSKFHTFHHSFLRFFHCSSSKFTTTTAQFPFYNCKLHFTTAQIVISCTLKYALSTGTYFFYKRGTGLDNLWPCLWKSSKNGKNKLDLTIHWMWLEMLSSHLKTCIFCGKAYLIFQSAP